MATANRKNELYTEIYTAINNGLAKYKGITLNKYLIHNNVLYHLDYL